MSINVLLLLYTPSSPAYSLPFSTHLDDLDTANLLLLSLYLGVMTAILPPLLTESTTTISSTRLELAGTLQVLVLVLILNFYALISSVALTNTSST